MVICFVVSPGAPAPLAALAPKIRFSIFLHGLFVVGIRIVPTLFQLAIVGARIVVGFGIRILVVGLI